MAEVVLVASSFLPRVGGVEEHVLHVARELRRQGVDVAIWTVDQRDDVPADVDGIPIRVLPCPLPARSLRALASFAWRAPRALGRWFAAVRHDRPAVLHVHCFGPNGVWASAIARMTRRRLVVTSHGETLGDADDVFGGSALLRRALREALSRAAVVTAPSRSTLTDLESRFGLRAGGGVIVANGVNLDEPAADPPAGLPERYVLAYGRLVRTKGFDLLLDAFAAAELPPDVHLVIGGDGPARTELESLAERLGVRERTHFCGRLSRGQVVTVTRGALALGVPSRAESFGIVVLEGWRAGIPVIATSHGGPPEFVRDGRDGWIVDPFDTPALAAALRRIVDDPENAATVASAGRARAKEYSWRRIALQYAQLYAHVGGVRARR
ncbi:glycosyltransferase family 4 protein [Microbacterium sp. NPDC055357]